MDKRRIVKQVLKIFWLFIIGSILGYLFEMIIVLFQKGHFESRQGVIYGPFTPVYGIGAVIYYIFFEKVKTKNLLEVFLISMILGGITEYLCSFIQEKCFGTISWDYSYLLFNLNGRTSLLHCSYWGIAGVLYIKYIKPMLQKMEELLERNYMKAITLVFSIFMLFNIIISWIAADRQKERMNHIVPKNKVDIFLDKHYSDERMDKIFSNKKYVD